MRALIAAAIVLISSSVSLAADEYKIMLSRPSRAGASAKFTEKVTFRQTFKTDANGKTSDKTVAFIAVLEGTLTIDAVSEKGNATALTVTVGKLLKDDKELLPPGTVIQAVHNDGKTEFEIDGTKPSDILRPVIAQLIYTSAPDGPSSDEMSGTDKPQKVGGTWPIHNEVFAPFFSTGVIMLNADQIKGECTLKDVATIDGVPSETITMTATADAPDRNPNNSLNVHDVKLKVERSDTFPVANNVVRAVLKSTLSLTYKYDRKNAVTSVSYERVREERYAGITAATAGSETRPSGQ